ncbi:serine hydrolase domain-containing protein [Marinicella sp. W31]|uniref:serine hydrolase domain-containing protein n=1 Tax=Marinicella sp. W31 TaxID=3023713 RepID=UPI0037566105
MLRNALYTLILLLIHTQCIAENNYSYVKPEQISDGWPTQHIESLATNTERINLFFNQLMDSKHKIHSTLLVKDGTIILEEYFDDYSRDTKHDMRSVTKSVTALLIGIALEKGYIRNLDDTIWTYLKKPTVRKNPDPRKNNITIRHLLTMSSGLECNDWDKKSKGQEDRVYKKKDWLQYTVDLPMINTPGKAAFYCSMGVTLLKEIISQTSGQPIDVFADTYLFKPLGIHNIRWGHTSKRKNIIPSGKRLYMTSRDLAKIGQLMLNQGLWNSTQVVSQQWIKSIASSQTQLANLDYSFLWWRIPFPVQDHVHVSTTATGNGGQYIFVFQELNMVAIFTGGAYNSEEDKLPFAVVKDVYLPTILSSIDHE